MAAIKNLKTLDSAIHKIISTTYPEKDAHKYASQLTTVNQNDYYYISEYEAQVNILIKQYEFCVKLKLNEIELREAESFMRELHPRTRLELARLDLFNKNAIIQHIHQVEGHWNNFKAI